MLTQWGFKRSTSASKVIFLLLWVAAVLLCTGEVRLYGDQLFSHVSKKTTNNKCLQLTSSSSIYPCGVSLFGWPWITWQLLSAMIMSTLYPPIHVDTCNTVLINCFIHCVIVYTNLSLKLEHYRSSFGPIIVFICSHSFPFLFYLKALIVIERLKRRGGEKLRIHHRKESHTKPILK